MMTKVAVALWMLLLGFEHGFGSVAFDLSTRACAKNQDLHPEYGQMMKLIEDPFSHFSDATNLLMAQGFSGDDIEIHFGRSAEHLSVFFKRIITDPDAFFSLEQGFIANYYLTTISNRVHLDWNSAIRSGNRQLLRYLRLWYPKAAVAVQEDFKEALRTTYRAKDLARFAGELAKQFGYESLVLRQAASKINSWSGGKTASGLLANVALEKLPERHQTRLRKWLLDEEVLNWTSVRVKAHNNCGSGICPKLTEGHLGSIGFTANEHKGKFVRVRLNGVVLGSIKIVESDDPTFLSWRTIRTRDGRYPLITGAAYGVRADVAYDARVAFEKDPRAAEIAVTSLDVLPIRFAEDRRRHSELVEFLKGLRAIESTR